MVKIYCIEDHMGLKCIGSTIQKLNERFGQHRSYNNCMSKELNLTDCKIYILEECDEEHRKVREQYWIDNTDCVNYRNTIFDKKEYKKEYYKQNIDKNLEYQKNYYHYKNSWGGDPRSNNNLLKIDLNIFL